MQTPNAMILERLERLMVRWWFEVWSDPWMWVAISSAVFVLIILGTRPITAPRNEEAGLFTHLAVYLRQAAVAVFGFNAFLIPLVVAIIGSHRYGMKPLASTMWQQAVDRFMYWWELPVGAVVVASALTFLGRRYVVSRWSALTRRLRMRQTGEELSDIRIEGGKLAPKSFLPTQFYKKDEMFLGLDMKGRPVYVPDKKWISMHMKVIGPSQTGKGVLLGVLCDQAIRKGQMVFAIDPKPDAHLKSIMKQAAKESGRRFMELDLNDGSVHRWAPFAGGTKRDRRARVLAAFGLADTGEQADFYKAGERALLDQLLENWSGDLASLRNLIEHGRMSERMQRTLSYVNEWLSVSTFSPQKNRGFSIERAFRENAVVWVRGHLADQLVIKAATIFIMEVIQEGMRLYKNGRTSHCFFPIDEVRFMVSDTLANGLATIAGFDMNCVVAYQSLLDLLALRDKQVNAKSIAESINVNCKLTVCYQAANSETAEWAAKLSGTVQKSVTRMEAIKTGRFGAEEWEKDRMVARTEEQLIPENTMLALPERVSVLFRPGMLAMPLFTSWIPVKDSPVEPVVARELPAEEEVVAESTEQRKTNTSSETQVDRSNEESKRADTSKPKQKAKGHPNKRQRERDRNIEQPMPAENEVASSSVPRDDDTRITFDDVMSVDVLEKELAPGNINLDDA